LLVTLLRGGLIVRSGYLHKIVVLNPKGGSGKTSLATTIAAALAARGAPPTLVDCDPQGYSLRWLEKRPPNRPAIHGVAGYSKAAAGDSLRQLVGTDSSVVVVDLPGAIAHEDLHDFTYFADRVLIPVVPSAIDVFAASRLIANLLLDAQLDRRDGKLAIVGNRVRSTTRSYAQLCAFLASLRIPMIAALRDTQNFVHAAALGLGITELPASAVREEIEQVARILSWLDRRSTETDGGVVYEDEAAREPEAQIVDALH
jgi:chromosome partitioning protein